MCERAKRRGRRGSTHRYSSKTRTTHLILRDKRVLGLGQHTLEVLDGKSLQWHNAWKAAHKLWNETKLRRDIGDHNMSGNKD